MEQKIIDRKYRFLAVNPCTGQIHDESDSILFLVKDQALPVALRVYRDECERLGCSDTHLESLDLLYERVIFFQETNVKLPETDTPCEVNRCIGGKV